ncbi:MAG: hypothetical protein IAE99_09515 [Rhodothermales bacterium]|nr:hypothetical protein [Rhodothermales bacterium]
MRPVISALGLAAACAALVVAAPRPEASAVYAEPEEEGFKQDRPDEFQRYFASIREPDGGAGEGYAPGYQVRALDAAMAAAKTGSMLTWEEHGPANVAGRARALVRDVRDASNNTWFAGTAGGGIWKTINGGVSWTNASGTMPNLAVSALAQAPSLTTTFYAGTGEGFGNADAIRGSGIFKSTDGGTTWDVLPASFSAGIVTVNRLRVSPTDANRVVAATTTGIYLSTDGGASWTKSTTVTAPTQDLVATPDFGVLVASVDGTCSSTPPRLYRSTDGGASWALTTGSSIAGGRSELAIAPSRTQRMYATVEACDGTSKLHVSDDTGATWKAVANASGSNWLGAQGWYDNSIAVHPFNADAIFVGGIDLWTGTVSNATGATPSASFTRRTVWSASTTATNYIHADNHAIVPFVTNAATQAYSILTATDGGMFVSSNGGISWSARNGGLTTTQFYGADKQPGAAVYAAGAQDNGTWISPSNPGSTSAWTRYLGGDGFDTIFNDAGEFIGSLYFNQLYRFTSSGYTDATTGLDDVGDGLGPFITHLGHTRANPDRVLAGGVSGMWRSDDFGRSWSAAAMVNTGVSGASWGFTGLRTVVAVSMADSRVAWAGHRMSTNGNVWVSTDGGGSFRPTPNASGISARLSGFATHPTDRNTGYALFSVADAPKILRTTDLGQTWTSLTGTFAAGAALSSNGFPNVAAYSLLVMPYDPNVMWAGTEIGLFVSTNGGASWAYSNDGLPPVAIWQMRLADGGRVVLATHGRGVWTVAVPELATYVYPQGIVPPLLSTAGFTAAGLVTASGTARAPYDSLVVKVDDVTVAKITTPASGQAFDVSTPVATTPARTVLVQAIGYSGGEPYASGVKSVNVYAIGAPVVTYLNAFDAPSDGSDFLSEGPGFGIRTVSGFSTSVAANLASPYQSGVEYTYRFTRPVTVAASDAIVRFNEIALLEACDDGSTYCATGYYDYATLEGSRDGSTWLPLAGPYDSRGSSLWYNAYKSASAPTSAMFQTRTVNLSPTFSAGENIFLRFRLSTDGSVTSWGWAIDDLEIQPNAVANDEVSEPVRATALRTVFPNPVRSSASVEVVVAEAGPADVFVVDVLGRRVRTLHTGTLAPGTHRLTLDAAGLSGGLYFVRLDAGAVHQTRGLTVVR